jgi:ABC-2 type transport system permease protein
VAAVGFLGFFPSFSDVDIDELAQAYPPAVQEAFGIEAIGSVEGFLAVEVYQFLWLLLLGLYVAYVGANSIADDIERDRMDLVLSLLVFRGRVVLEAFAAVTVPILVLNTVVPLAVYGGVVAIGESISVSDLAMVHLLSIPYLLTCTAIGLLLSVLVSRASIASRIAIALIFVLFVIESITASTADYEWMGAVSPTHYYDPTEILVSGSYDLTGAVVLLAATGVLVLLARTAFSRRDI